MKSTSPLSVNRALNTLLDGAYWLRTLETRVLYERRQDDTDGDLGVEQFLGVVIGPDGDAWVNLPGLGRTLRFRTWAGGGQSLRVRNALLVLAEAIRRDNQERPQPPVPAATSLKATTGSTGAACTWTEQGPEQPGVYLTSCGEQWDLKSGTPVENRILYCHGCGKPVIKAAPVTDGASVQAE